MSDRMIRIAQKTVALLACLLALSWASSASAWNDDYGKCKTNNLPVIKENTTDVLMYLMAGDVVELVAVDNEWWKIKLIDKNGANVTGRVKSPDANPLDDHFEIMAGPLAKTQKALETSGGSGTSASTSSYRNLKFGSTGADVRNLQQKLKDLKFYTGSVTGTFGTKTQAAVKAYQKSAGLTADGIAGPLTQTKLFGASSGGSGSSSSAGTSNGSKYSDQAITNAKTVTLRSGPSTSNSSKATLSKGARVTVLGTTKKSDATWYNVNYNGTTGYIRSDMLRILTWAEAGGSPSSGSSGGGDTSGGGSSTTVYRNLKSGSTGSDVRALQQKLRDIGYTSVSVNGTYDSKTLAAVRDFQKKNGLSSDGVAGPLTQAALYGTASGGGSSSGGASSGNNNSGTGGDDKPADAAPPSIYRTLKVGSSGEDVRALQQKLKDLGIYSGSVTGTFGTLTENAVRAFQKAHGLKVDGIAGPGTQAKVYSIATGSNAKPTINGVKLETWVNFYAAYQNRFVRGDKAVLTDARLGRSFNIVCQSMGANRHLDAEPATAADTAVLLSIYGGTINYLRRPVWLTMSDGNTYAASLYGVPHGASYVSGNNFAGQFCVHMIGSQTNTGTSVCPDHQKAIQEAYDLAGNR